MCETLDLNLPNPILAPAHPSGRHVAGATQNYGDTERTIGRSPLVVLCHSSITIAVASVILLLASKLLSLFSAVSAWKDFS
jgi:hypothetical protein